MLNLAPAAVFSHAVLEVRGVTKRYGAVTALRGVGSTVGPGEAPAALYAPLLEPDVLVHAAVAAASGPP